MDKSWLEKEIDKSEYLLLERLKELNDSETDIVDLDTVKEIEKIYKCFCHFKNLKKT